MPLMVNGKTRDQRLEERHFSGTTTKQDQLNWKNNNNTAELSDNGLRKQAYRTKSKYMNIHYPILIFSLYSLTAAAQSCSNGLRIEGVVTDPGNLVIQGAQVKAASGPTAVTDSEGHFVLPCVTPPSAEISIEAPGFAPKTESAPISPNGRLSMRIQLALSEVETVIQVGDEPAPMEGGEGPGSRTLNTKDIERLANDPDDLIRELQALAATTGGAPSSTAITVDGFENTSALPPKDSIAFIRINPDLFSSEYQWPPFASGGHVDVVTKVGGGSLHGSLFFTDSDGSFNATNPFSSTSTPAGKRRYGFTVGGPIVPKKIGFNLAFEKRDIDEFNVVNAITLDGNNNQEALHQTVSAPQRLWVASARGDMEVSASDSATASFAANVNDLDNQGVGGLTLAEAGYTNHVSEYTLQLKNTQTFGPNLVHETRLGFTWKDTVQTPLSTAPQLQVAGFFVGGGFTGQQLNNRDRSLEVNDDILYVRGKHSLKIGAKALGYFVHDFDPDTFNGAFVFGGGSAPVLDTNGQPLSQATNINALEQYRRARLNLAGGVPTTFQITSGTALVNYTQWQTGLYAQDTIKLRSNVTLSAGIRSQLQTSPASFLNLEPRIGVAWALGKKSSTVLHARAGLFNDFNNRSTSTEAFRLNGIRQRQALVYSPSFIAPLTPVPGSFQVSTVRALPHSLSEATLSVFNLSVEQSLSHGWSMSVGFIYGVAWNGVRVRNINAPIVASSNNTVPDPTAVLFAPRPLAPNMNILQFQNTGHLAGNVVRAGISQNSFKRASINVSYVHTSVSGNYGNDLDVPQSSYTDHGESGKASWVVKNRMTLTGNLTLPRKVELSSVMDAESGSPFNLTTGTDANGDGTFNDRPSYATVPGNGVFATRFGLLSTNAINGNVPKNLGTLPTTIHLDLSVSRTFNLNRGPDHQRTLTLNVRSANLLNHTNVTAVGTVVSSPTFAQSLAAEAARRIELGARVNF